MDLYYKFLGLLGALFSIVLGFLKMSYDFNKKINERATMDTTYRMEIEMIKEKIEKLQEDDERLIRKIDDMNTNLMNRLENIYKRQEETNMTIAKNQNK